MEVVHTFVILAYKESKYLEDCIKSAIDQEYKSKVVIATSTPNKYIETIALKYNLQIIINTGEKGIGKDFDFQDDIYNKEYSKNIVEKFQKYNKTNKKNDVLIVFSDYYEIKKEGIVKNNLNLIIKRILLFPIRIANKTKFVKRLILRFGCSICCPAVTFNKDNVKTPVFDSEFKSDVDWNAWEVLSKQKGRFLFVPKKIMGHRVHDESTTTEIIKDNIRTKEDMEMFRRFWPEWIAKIINKVYVKSEKSNGK